MSTTGWIILSGGLVLGVVTVFLFALLRILKQQATQQSLLFEQKIREEIKFSQDQFLELAKKQFEVEQNKAATELETRKQAVESSVKGLKEELSRYQVMMRDFEKDRENKYGNLENELKNASNATTRLQESTSHLNNILGNVKLRGQWGERMAEDIIKYAGLIEGVNYLKQKKQDFSTTKPDFTFLLPNDYKINMDVKFPLDNYTKMVNAQVDSDKEAFLKDFLRNVKDRIKEIQNREYINPNQNTLDFVLLFIPNEQVFGMIQEQLPELLDTALTQKVVLCSPFTLYAMLSVIRQAYENFRYEKDLKKIIKIIDDFTKHYDRFKGRFDNLGKSIGRLDTQYSDIRTKSFKQLDTKIRQIDDHKKGNRIPIPKDDHVIEITDQNLNDESILQ